MNRKKKLSNRLMAVLLSMAMIFSSMLQSMPVYAAEDGVETESVVSVPEDLTESAADVSGNDTADKESAADVSGNDNTDAAVEPTDDVSANDVTDNDVTDDTKEDSVSDNDVTNETDETENPFGSEIKATVKAAASMSAGGWNESIYAEISGISAADVSEVSWTGAMDGKLGTEDLKYLVRDDKGKVRIDIPGLKAGTYTLNVKAGANTLTESGIKVEEYDRAGFAHFGYGGKGVGAYNDDGTLKDKAVILYVTNDNKNDVTLTAGGVTVKGIGNILNSVGKDVGSGVTSNGGKPNTNQGVIKNLADEGKPLVVRFVGTVSESGLGKKGTYTASDAGQIDGLTDYDSTGNGGTVGDNGHMARIQSGKDITLEGIGYDATIDGWGFHFISEGAYPQYGESFEVRNLTFINTPEDAVGMEGQQANKNANSKLSSEVQRCWIHNNEFYSPSISGPAESDKADGDGSVDFKRGEYFTCSYNYFEGCHKTNLVGSADYSLQFNLSYHHNYWYLCKARGPLTRRANVHMYNNIFEMQTDYAQNTRADAYIFSEYNLFYACKSPQAVEGGAIKSYNDTISSVIWNKGNAGTVVTDKSTIVPNNCKFAAEGIDYDKFDTDSKLSYIPTGDYELTEDFTDLRKLITVQTGVMDENPRKPEDVNESEYSVIERLGDEVTPVVLNGDTKFTLDPSAKGYKNGKINKKGYAFSVNAEFNIKITYSSASKLTGVLVNAAGENLLYGSGEAVNLPAGKYMIQSEGLQPGDPKKLTPATFKETTIESIEITPYDSSKHYHNWVKNESESVAASCTNAGKDVYDCVADGCTQGENRREEVTPKLDHKYTLTNSTATCTAAGKATYKCSVGGETYDEDVAALGHNFVWKTDKEATATETGLKHEECTRCGTKQSENTEIPVGTPPVVEPPVNPNPDETKPTEGGEFELYFTNRRLNGDTDFFTVNAGGGYSDSKGVVTVGENEYKYSLKMASSTVAFSCNDGATLYLAFAPGNAGLKVMVNTTEYTIGSDGTLTLENLSAGTYTIAKLNTSSEKDLNYVLVTNPEPEIEYCNVTFEYNDDDGREPIVLQIAKGKSYDTMYALIPGSFNKTGYILKGLYMDEECTIPVGYPYTVNSDVSLYADWEKDDRPIIKMYSIVFNSNGGSAVSDVRIAANRTYEITQKPMRADYAFAGWYDSTEGGNLIERVDGSKLSGTLNLYAHWNVVENVKYELDCSSLYKENDSDGKAKETDITANTTVNGFTIHALAGESADGTKYYMTAKKDDGMLYTNGVLIKADDAKSPAEGNEDGVLKSIEFTTEGSGYLTVDVQLSGNSAANGKYYLVLAHKDENGNLVEDGREVIVSGEKKANQTRAIREFAVIGANTYYLYAEGDKGVAYASIRFTEQTFTVTYDTGNGTTTQVLETSVVHAGDVLQLNDCVPADGYTFKDWSVNNGSKTFKNSYTVSADDEENGLIEIAAVYDSKEYTLKYDVNGGTLPTGTNETATVKTGDTITLPVCTPSAGNKFIGWELKSSLISGSYIVNPADADNDNTITLKAVYATEGDNSVYYKVTLDTDGGTLVSGGGTERLIKADEVFDPGECEKTGYVFKSWSVNETSVKMPYEVTQDVTLRAEYSIEDVPESFEIKYQTGDGTAPTGLVTSAYENAVITLGDCVPAKGYTFMGWSVNNGEVFKGPYTVKAEDAKNGVITIVAVYKAITYTVRFDANGGKLPEGTADTATGTIGKSITLPECEAPEGKTFFGWKVGDTVLPGTYVVKAEDADADNVITLKAEYVDAGTTVYTVTLDTDGGSLVGNGETIFRVVENATITPAACEKAGYTFMGWSVEGELVTIPYTVKKDVTLKAVYDAITYNVKLDVNGGTLPEGTAVTATGTIGESIALPECEAPEGMKFSGWKVGDTLIKKSVKAYKINPADADNTNTITLKAEYVSEGTVSGEGLAIIGLEESYPYTGAKIIPNIGVVDYDVEGGKILAPGVDYTVKYKNNTKVTTAAVITVTGKGNYAGKDIKKTFKIVEVKDVTADLADLKGAKLDKIDPVVYNGEAQYPDFKLTLKTGSAAGTAVEYTYNGEFYETKVGGEQIKANVALSNNINKGTATILITGAAGKNNKPTSIKKTFKINAIDLAAAAITTNEDEKVTVEAEDGVYSVKGAAPASITVKYGDKTLINGTDYTVKYSNNKKVTDTAKITITGKGNYAKKITTYTYKISPLDLSTVEVSAVNAVEGMKAGKVKATVLDANDNILKPSQYNVEVYVDGARQDANAALAKGTISVKVTAKDTVNLKGDTEAEFNVADKSKDISKAKFVFPKVNGKAFSKTYTGEHVVLTTDDKIEVTIKDKGATKKLVMGDDFEIVAYSNNVNKGTATAVVKGIGDYCGTKTIKFKIVGKDMKLQNEGASWDDVSGLIKNLMGNLFD